MEWGGKATANCMKGKVQVEERKGTRDSTVIKMVLGEDAGSVTQPSPKTHKTWVTSKTILFHHLSFLMSYIHPFPGLTSHPEVARTQGLQGCSSPPPQPFQKFCEKLNDWIEVLVRRYVHSLKAYEWNDLKLKYLWQTLSTEKVTTASAQPECSQDSVLRRKSCIYLSFLTSDCTLKAIFTWLFSYPYL